MKLYEEYSLNTKLEFHSLSYDIYEKKLKNIDMEIFGDTGYEKQNFEANLAVARYATLGNNIVGYYIVKKKSEKACGLQTLAVVEKYRRKGIGRMILRNSFDETRTLGFNKMTLGVFVSEKEAIHLYLSEGFRIIRKIDNDSRYIMEKKL